MYSLIIVENDQMTRRGLSTMVKWEEMGFQVMEKFSRSQEALEYLKEHIPDVILTEAQQPEADGIELARFADQHHLKTRIVFLTASRSFEHARQAVEYHVCRYLLKPVSIPEIRSVFMMLKTALDQENRREEKEQYLLRHYQKLLSHEKQHFVTDAYYGGLSNPGKLEHRINLLGTEPRLQADPGIFLLRVEICRDEQFSRMESNYGIQELENQVVQILESYDSDYDFYSISWNSMGISRKLRLLGVLWEKDEKSEPHHAEPDPQRFGTGLRDMIYSLMALDGRLTHLIRLHNLRDLTHCAEFVREKESSEKVQPDVDYLQKLRDQKKALYNSICQKDQEKICALSHEFVESCMCNGAMFAYRQCYHALTQLIERLTDNDLKAWNKLYMECLSPHLFSELQQEELEKRFTSRLMILYRYVCDQSQTKNDSSIEKVMTYIQEHCCEDITLTEIAEKVYLNPVYISRLIKEQTGMNYTDLVMELRIEHAVELLETTDKFVYEVAEEVGYHNLKYFYKVFKKVKGKSPGDYRPEHTEK